MSTYTFRNFYIPPHMLAGLQRYIGHGEPVGGFLTAVLENDLIEACSRADDVNLENLPAYAAFLYARAPRDCYGSPEKVAAWIAMFETALVQS